MKEIDPRFKYETYERNVFATREELTSLAKIILDTKAGLFSVILNTIRITALLALFKIRQAMFDEELLLKKQIYEQERWKDSEDVLDDDLDG